MEWAEWERVENNRALDAFCASWLTIHLQQEIRVQLPSNRVHRAVVSFLSIRLRDFTSDGLDPAPPAPAAMGRNL